MVESKTAQYVSKFLTRDNLRRELFSIAPMVDVTDKWYRYFMRLLSKHSVLYSEMINENAVLHHADKPNNPILSYT
jgi:tRNA-dihydrouridine synthase